MAAPSDVGSEHPVMSATLCFDMAILVNWQLPFSCTLRRSAIRKGIVQAVNQSIKVAEIIALEMSQVDHLDKARFQEGAYSHIDRHAAFEHASETGHP